MSTNKKFYYPRKTKYVVYFPQDQNLDKVPYCKDLNRLRARATQILKTRKRDKNMEVKLSEADKEAWWGVIKEKYPKNYELAKIYYGEKEDPNLIGTCTPQQLYINDYFSIYDLPRITSKNNEICVNDAPTVEYRIDTDHRKQREIFYRAQKEKEFHIWKKQQFFFSQDGRCAWCNKDVDYGDTEVDHIQPLLYYGSNYSKNLVVSCKECNQIKGADRYGWNDDMNPSKPNARPSWIKFNRRYPELRVAIAKATEDIENGKV